MNIGRLMPAWLSSGAQNEASSNSAKSAVDSGIKPVLYEYRDMIREVEDIVEETRDCVLDKMENYFYKQMDDVQNVQFLFEKIPKEKLVKLGLSYFDEREQGLVKMQESINGKLTKKTVENYDKFCMGIRMVSEIKDIVLRKSDQFNEVNRKHKIIKSFYVNEINQIIKKRSVYEKKKKLLELLERVRSSIGNTIDTYRSSLKWSHVFSSHSHSEDNLENIRILLIDINEYEKNEKKIESEILDADSGLRPLAANLSSMMVKGSPF